MPKLRILRDENRAPSLVELISANEQQGQSARYKKDLAEIQRLLPSPTVAELEKRGLRVTERATGLLLARLKGARLKNRPLNFELVE
jgi:hypothetical protein